MHRTTSRIVLAVIASFVAIIGLSSPSQAVTKLTDAQAASQLSAAGISRVSTGGCTDRNVSTCTSYEQINQESVSGIITFKGASGCAITITGGTETGHAGGTYSHANGYKVDIRPTDCVSSFITSTYAYSGVRGDGATLYTAPSGNVYAREGSHWDITYYSCGGC
ncbi:hypothetical protein SAMN04489844_1395 [Nocardioides exalbidus]|uniref:Peptidase inhibitor family I36 n=1 Tax=Nocardioides exalbidus TaxID=402596 RepID=A0A1H4NJS5_9ACTN|nr:hypothetical protein [Nocardioides exalbidus]SEB95540.1 hypothetical protein SAMN04489844_1395 [Nocardioides exalbidus]